MGSIAAPATRASAGRTRSGREDPPGPSRVPAREPRGVRALRRGAGAPAGARARRRRAASLRGSGAARPRRRRVEAGRRAGRLAQQPASRRARLRVVSRRARDGRGARLLDDFQPDAAARAPPLGPLHRDRLRGARARCRDRHHAPRLLAAVRAGPAAERSSRGLPRADAAALSRLRRRPGGGSAWRRGRGGRSVPLGARAGPLAGAARQRRGADRRAPRRDARGVARGRPPDLALALPALARRGRLGDLRDPSPRERPRADPEGRAKRARPGRLRVGFLGSAIPSKGVHVLAEAFRQARSGPGLARDPRRLSALPRRHRLRGARPGDPGAGRRRCHRAGRSRREALGEVLAGLDVLVVPSIWEENPPLVVQEAFLARRARRGRATTAAWPRRCATASTACASGPATPRISRASCGACWTSPACSRRLGDRAARRCRRWTSTSAALRRSTSEARRRFARAAGPRRRRRARSGPAGRGRCRGGARSSTRPSPRGVLVVENGPGAGLASRRPGSRCCGSPENRGFAGGMNAGIERLRARRLRPYPAAQQRRAPRARGPAPPGRGARGPRPGRGGPADPARARTAASSRAARASTRARAASGCAVARRAAATRARAAAGRGALGGRLMLSGRGARPGRPARRELLPLLRGRRLVRARPRGGLRPGGGAGRAGAPRRQPRTLGAASPERLYYAARNHLRAVERLWPLRRRRARAAPRPRSSA